MEKKAGERKRNHPETTQGLRFSTKCFAVLSLDSFQKFGCILFLSSKMLEKPSAGRNKDKYKNTRAENEKLHREYTKPSGQRGMMINRKLWSV